MDRVPKDMRWIGRDEGNISSVVFTSEPYTPWSDNNRFASFRIPSPLILSSPSIHFHTQFLTAETMDPKVFERAGIVAATGLYEIANAGCREAYLMARDVLSASLRRLQRISSDAVRRVVDAGGEADEIMRVCDRAVREINYLRERDAEAIRSILTLIPEGDQDAVSDDLTTFFDQLEDGAERGIAWIRQRGADIC